MAPKVLNPGEALKIIWHSRVSKEKRIMPFLEALTKVKGKYRLDIYGDGNDLSRAKRYAKTHHLNARFHGAKPFKEIYAKIIDSHLDVLASYNFDNYPMTLVEAESAGTPVLFVDPDLKEVVPSTGAILTSSPDSDSIASAINYLIEHPDKITAMSKAMLARRDEVRVSNIVNKLEKYINE